MDTVDILVMFVCAQGTVILALGGLIAKSIFRMADNIKELTSTLAHFVKKDDCKEDMGEHCGKIETLEKRIDKNEKALESLKAKAEIWHQKN